MTSTSTARNHRLLSKSKLGRAVDMSTYGNSRGDPSDFREFVVSTGLIRRERSSHSDARYYILHGKSRMEYNKGRV